MADRQTQKRWRIVPCTLKQANEKVAALHRHHKPIQGHRFSLALEIDKEVVGVVICGRPAARKCDPYLTLEISRCATIETTEEKNLISRLYGAVFRVAKAMGFETVQTYTLPEEGGVSMRASNFEFAGECGGGQWKHTDGRERRTDQPTQKKHKWVKRFAKQYDAELEAL